MITRGQVMDWLINPLAEVYSKPPGVDGWLQRIADQCSSGITEASVREAAERLIETRKQRSFPSVQELIALVKNIRPGGSFEESEENVWEIPTRPVWIGGPSPVWWITTNMPEWKDASARWWRDNRGKNKRLPIHTSRYHGGKGWYFPPNYHSEAPGGAVGFNDDKKTIEFLKGRTIARRAVEQRWAPALFDFVTTNGREPDTNEERLLVAKSRRNDVDVRDLGGILGVKFRQLRDAMHAKAERMIQ